MKNKDIIIIGIVGASGSGKSLISNSIVNNLKDISLKRVYVLSEDNYYKDHKNLCQNELNKLNYDHPDAFDHNLLKNNLTKLINGKEILAPMYDYSTHRRFNNKSFYISSEVKILILEGLMLFTNNMIRDIIDIKIFMDTPMDISFIRRLSRDRKERKRSINSIIEQYLKTVRPMFLQFVKPSKSFADIVIPHGGKNKIAIDIICSKARELLVNISK